MIICIIDQVSVAWYGVVKYRAFKIKETNFLEGSDQEVLT